uniref:Uncharacterized protein n=1 Tax=Anguilla anguilla TaxID=7936 RepID=A0A0E9SNR7_ANGAN
MHWSPSIITHIAGRMLLKLEKKCISILKSFRLMSKPLLF